MSVGEFETNNLSWQLQQWQQQAQEWMEFTLGKLVPSGGEFDLPHWSIGNLDWLMYSIGILLAIAIAWQLRGLILQLWDQGMWRISEIRSPIPAHQQLTVKTLLKRSRQYQEQGNYRAACHCLYLAMLQQLDESQMIPQQTSLTDGEYDRLLQDQPHYWAYKVLLETHERLYFGKQSANADMFQRCQEAYETIEQKL